MSTFQSCEQNHRVISTHIVQQRVQKPTPDQKKRTALGFCTYAAGNSGIQIYFTANSLRYEVSQKNLSRRRKVRTLTCDIRTGFRRNASL